MKNVHEKNVDDKKLHEKKLHEKIYATDTIKDAIMKLSEGNPGALAVLCDLIKLDQDKAVIQMLVLTEIECYGPDVWIGFKDIHGQDIGKFGDAIMADPKKLRADIDAAKDRFR